MFSEHLVFLVRNNPAIAAAVTQVAGPHFILQVGHKNEIQAICDVAI